MRRIVYSVFVFVLVAAAVSAVGASSGQDVAPVRVGAVVNSVGMLLRHIPPGEFVMGTGSGENGHCAMEAPQHRVILSRGFRIGITEVTQGQWYRVMGTRPWAGKPNAPDGEDFPAVHIGWHDAAAFCKRLSEVEEAHYRLPTEAEWEYACRAGTTTSFSFGDDARRFWEHGWFSKNALDAGQRWAHRVGSKKPNLLGLFDMHGNVGEWCSDWLGSYPTGPATDPAGPKSGSHRVVRGGAWLMDSIRCRSGARPSCTPSQGAESIGFRVVLEVE